MSKVIILGSPDSGRKTLHAAIRERMPDYQLDVISGDLSSTYDAAILVISAVDGPMPETKEQLVRAKKAGIPNVFCFLNKMDLIDDGELAELVEMECQELASNYGYADSNFALAAGCATTGTGIDDLADLVQGNIDNPDEQPNFQFPEYRCKHCGHVEDAPFDQCPSCLEKQKVSFWKRLFGGG